MISPYPLYIFHHLTCRYYRRKAINRQGAETLGKQSECYQFCVSPRCKLPSYLLLSSCSTRKWKNHACFLRKNTEGHGWGREVQSTASNRVKTKQNIKTRTEKSKVPSSPGLLTTFLHNKQKCNYACNLINIKYNTNIL